MAGCPSPTTAAASPSKSIPNEKKSNLEVVMTIVGAGGKFDNKAYKIVGRPARHGRQGRRRP